MANNTIPIHVLRHRLSWAAAAVNTGNTTTDLTSGTSYDIFTANAVNDSFVREITFRPLGSNAVTVARIWINNGLTSATAANNTLLTEITLPATTVSQVAALLDTTVCLNMGLPAGYRIYVTLGTTVASGFDVTVKGGDY